MAQSTTDLTIDCAQALSVFVNDITQALSAINSCHAGTSAPTYNVEEGVLWLDTSDGDYVLKMYINSSWVTVVDKTGDEFATVGGNVIKGRLDAHDAKFNGTSTCSLDLIAGSWKIDNTTVNVTVNEFDQCVGLNADVQDGIDQEETPYTHPTTTGWFHVPVGGSTEQILRYSADGVATWDDPDPSIAGVDDVGQTELDSDSLEETYTPYYSHTSLYNGLNGDPNYTSITGESPPYNIGTLASKYTFFPQVKVEIDPFLNLDDGGTQLYPGDPYYIDPNDVNLLGRLDLSKEVTLTHQYNSATAYTTVYNTYSAMSGSAGCKVTSKYKYL
jgi:hypothetical protein